MIFYGDDTEFVSHTSIRKSQDVFCVGGFGIEDFKSIRKIEELIESVKIAYKVPLDLPLKWNMKDTKVEKLYREKGYDKLHKQILKDFDDIRMDIMRELPNLDIRVIVSSIRSLGFQSKNQLYEWAFTALLQRFGLSAAGELVNFIVLDWESERRDVYCEVYQNGYYKGEGKRGESYFSGPLRNLPAIPYLSFSVTVYNPILQLADFIVGCTGDFLKVCYTGRSNKKVKTFFPFVKECFNRSPSGEILKWGLIVQPRDDENIVKRNL
jgi:hypothetical protein